MILVAPSPFTLFLKGYFCSARPLTYCSHFPKEWLPLPQRMVPITHVLGNFGPWTFREIFVQVIAFAKRVVS